MATRCEACCEGEPHSLRGNANDGNLDGAAQWTVHISDEVFQAEVCDVELECSEADQEDGQQSVLC